MPDVILAPWLGLVGAVVGCFAGLVSLRLPAGEPIFLGRSHCRGCGQTLGAEQLLPLLSYVASAGRCASCGAQIPARYPLMEGSCALVGVCAALTQASIMAAVLTAILGWQLLLIAAVDAEHQWLPDALTFPLAISGIFAATALPDLRLLDSLGGGIAGFAGLWLVGRAYRLMQRREGLGGGDPFLLGAGGTWIGWAGLPLTILIASLGGLALVLAAGVRSTERTGARVIPFGPCLAVGIWLAWIFRGGS